MGELEHLVLEFLWTAEEADVAEAHRAVGRARGITPNTVGSALERLHRKGLVRRHKVSHAYRYAPSLARDDFAARRLVDAAGGLQSLSSVGLLSAFVDILADGDRETLTHLEQLIAAKRSGETDP
ncbi:MAG: BlaI/MecI/CopY family transcriptional regulator [Myxococcales bacterium]|nr:BlaI/MecI/CopY family transcriptional regulator [Myxococcales bacterium]